MSSSSESDVTTPEQKQLDEPRETPAPPEPILVLHGGDKYNISLANSATRAEIILVKDLALAVEKLSGVPVTSQRLIYKGRSLSNLDATLLSYGVIAGGKVMLLGSRPNAIYQSEELKTITQVGNNIKEKDNKLKGISNQIEELKKGFLPKPTEIAVLAGLTKDVKKVDEDLMKILEHLDGLSLADDQRELREKRKENIEQVQKLLLKTDTITEILQSMSP